MEKRRIYKSRLFRLGVVGALALGAVGCGDNSAQEGAGVERVDPQSNDLAGPAIHYDFYENGTMATRFSLTSDRDGRIIAIQKWSRCEGQDLVEDVVMQSHYANLGGSSERYPCHPYCADGQITPDDLGLRVEPDLG